MLLILKVFLLANVLGLQTLAQTPLIDFQAEERYLGRPGLLYDGTNQRPASLTTTAPSVDPINGRIVVASLGFSNVREEFATFFDQVELLKNDPANGINPNLAFVNLATPGCVASETSSLDAGGGRCWNSYMTFLNQAGVVPEEVQVVWMKVLSATQGESFPDWLSLWKEDMHGTLETAKEQFPNLKQVYLSSRIYSYEDPAPPSLSPEPIAYESGFSVREIVSEQHPGLWLSWGPYLWAQGAQPRSDGLTWLREDLQEDGVHPSSSGARKVANLLVDFFSTDEVAKQWFLGQASFFFPQFADGVSADLVFQSTLILTNTGSATPIRVEFFRTLDGEPMEVTLGELGTDSTFEFQLSAGGSISLTTPGTETLKVGYARVLASADVGGVIVFRRTHRTTGTILYEAGVPASKPLREFSIFVDSLGILDTGLAMVVPPEEGESQPAHVTLRLYDKEFNLIAQEAMEPLPAGTHLARFVHELFDDPDAKNRAREMEGVLSVRSDQPLAAVTVRQNDHPQKRFPEEVPILTTFPVVQGTCCSEQFVEDGAEFSLPGY